MVNLVYRFESEVAPVRSLRLKVEINTHEHFSVLGYQRKHMVVDSRWFSAGADVPTYGLDELMGTKLRALYQRRKGRDLFDLWLCLERGMIDPATGVQCFGRYMEAENHPVTRAQFEQNLHGKSQDRAFFADINPILATGVAYDPDRALRRVREAFIERLEGEPWRGIHHP